MPLKAGSDILKNKIEHKRILRPTALSVIWLFFYSCTGNINKAHSTLEKVKSTETKKPLKTSENLDSSLRIKLKNLSTAAINLGDYEFQMSDENWIGYEPATDSLITDVEKRLNVLLPEEYKSFVRITNGLPAINSVEPSFLPVSEIDYTKNMNPLLIKSWGNDIINPENAEKYKRSITIGGFNEEQMFFLIPPIDGSNNWEFWKFANWQAGEIAYPDLESYFLEVTDFCKQEFEN